MSKTHPVATMQLNWNFLIKKIIRTARLPLGVLTIRHERGQEQSPAGWSLSWKSKLQLQTIYETTIECHVSKIHGVAATGTLGGGVLALTNGDDVSTTGNHK